MGWVIFLYNESYVVNPFPFTTGLKYFYKEGFVMAAVNYAEKYERALAQAYPNVLNFGELYNAANNSIYTFLNAKTIHIPSISVTGRKNVNRDAIDGVFQRNVDDTYEDKTMQFYREWSTSLDPADVDDTNMVLTIQNATKVFNETQKFRNVA